MAEPVVAYAAETGSSPHPITAQPAPVAQLAVMGGSDRFAQPGSAASPVPVQSASCSGGSVPYEAGPSGGSRRIEVAFDRRMKMFGSPALRSMKPWSSRSGGFTNASSSEVAIRLRGASWSVVQVVVWA